MATYGQIVDPDNDWQPIDDPDIPTVLLAGADLRPGMVLANKPEPIGWVTHRWVGEKVTTFAGYGTPDDWERGTVTDPKHGSDETDRFAVRQSSLDTVASR